MLSSNPGDKTMNTKIASIAAIAFTAALVSGLVQFAPAVAQSPTEIAAVSQNVIYLSASQKVRCIMPVAQQKYCGA